jgi:hypothetical protein
VNIQGDILSCTKRPLLRGLFVLFLLSEITQLQDGSPHERAKPASI